MSFRHGYIMGPGLRALVKDWYPRSDASPPLRFHAIEPPHDDHARMMDAYPQHHTLLMAIKREKRILEFRNWLRELEIDQAG